MTRIRIERDEQFPGVVYDLAQMFPTEVGAKLEEWAENGDAIDEGTIIEDAEIDEKGRAHYNHPITGHDWYSPSGWYEVIE